MKGFKIPHVNAKEDQLWRWFSYPGGEASLEVRLVTRKDLQNADPGGKGFERYCAEHFVRGIKGFLDCNGTEVPNTAENRFQILIDARVWPWFDRQLVNIAEWGDEGKAVSGSAS
jgi:hypothetical protein